LSFAGPLLGVKVDARRILPLFDFGNPKPAERTFTTCQDGQARALFRLYLRLAPDSPWVYAGKAMIDDLPALPAGEPSLVLSVSSAGTGRAAIEIREEAAGIRRSFVLMSPRPPPERLFHMCRPTKKPERRRRRVSWPAITGAALGLVVLGVAALMPLRPAMLPFRRVEPAAERTLQPAAAPALEQQVTQPAAAAATEQQVTQPAAAPAPEQQAMPAAEQTEPGPETSAEAPDAETKASAPQAPKDEEPSHPYRVRWGDTLWAITERFYGDPHLFRLLAEENEIANPNLIVPGRELKIPATIDARQRRE
jgi:LysM repeat protein